MTYRACDVTKSELRLFLGSIKMIRTPEIKFEAQAEGEAKGEDEAKVPTNEKEERLLQGRQLALLTNQ